jgi:hypothetical protein
MPLQVYKNQLIKTQCNIKTFCVAHITLHPGDSGGDKALANRPTSSPSPLLEEPSGQACTTN